MADDMKRRAQKRVNQFLRYGLPILICLTVVVAVIELKKKVHEFYLKED